MNLFSLIISVFPLLDALPSIPDCKPSLMQPALRAACRQAAEAWILSSLLHEEASLYKAFLGSGIRERAAMTEMILDLYEQHKEAEGN